MKKVIRLFFFLLLFQVFIYAQQNPLIEQFLPETNVMDIAFDGEKFWLASDGNGVFSYDPQNDEWENFSTTNGKLNHDFIYCIDANEEYVWAGSSDGLFILDKKRGGWQKRKFAKGGQLSNWIRSIEYDKIDNVVWIGRFKYLTKLDIDRRRFSDYDLTVNGDVKSNNIISIKVDGDSLVWFGTEAGLHKHNKSLDLENPESVFFYDNRLNYFDGEGEHVAVSSILFEQKNIWFGLEEFVTEERPDFNRGGVFRYDRKNDWTKFKTENSLPGNGIFDMERTGIYIWVSTYQFGKATQEKFGRGLAIINSITEVVTPLITDEFPKTIYSLYFDGENMWAGTSDGIFKLKIATEFAKFN